MPTRPNKKQKWSQGVTEHSDALDLSRDVFKQRSPDKIAGSLKASAQKSRRRKGTAFQSAMSMLNFYINRAGRNLSQSRKRVLDAAKAKLREKFSRRPKA